MKPIRLEFNAFGPFAKKETVDFEEVAKSGLFLSERKNLKYTVPRSKKSKKRTEI